MNDTVKLIIEIPEELYRACKEYADERSEDDALFLELIAIAHGIPLDDVKAEIKKEYDIEAQNHDIFDDYSDGRYDAFSACLKIIDKYLADMRGE